MKKGCAKGGYNTCNEACSDSKDKNNSLWILIVLISHWRNLYLYNFYLKFISSWNWYEILDLIDEKCGTAIDVFMEKARYGNPEDIKKFLSKKKEETGVYPTVADSRFEDFQRLFKCLNIKWDVCNNILFPRECSKPPCNRCRGIGNKLRMLTLK